MLKICRWSEAMCEVAMAKRRNIKAQKHKIKKQLLAVIWPAYLTASLSTTDFTSCGQKHVKAAVEHTVQ